MERESNCAICFRSQCWYSLHLFILCRNVRLNFHRCSASPSSALSIPQSQLIQPEALNRMLQTGGAQVPLVLQVGSRVMYNQAHIPGSFYAGPGSQPDGLRLLENMVSETPRRTNLSCSTAVAARGIVVPMWDRPINGCATSASPMSKSSISRTTLVTIGFTRAIASNKAGRAVQQSRSAYSTVNR